MWMARTTRRSDAMLAAGDQTLLYYRASVSQSAIARNTIEDKEAVISIIIAVFRPVCVVLNDDGCLVKQSLFCLASTPNNQMTSTPLGSTELLLRAQMSGPEDIYAKL